MAGASASLGNGLTEAGARAAGLWVFVTSLPLAVAGVLAAWRLTREP